MRWISVLERWGYWGLQTTLVQAMGMPDELQTQLRQHSVAPEPLHSWQAWLPAAWTPGAESAPVTVARARTSNIIFLRMFRATSVESEIRDFLKSLSLSAREASGRDAVSWYPAAEL